MKMYLNINLKNQAIIMQDVLQKVQVLKAWTDQVIGLVKKGCNQISGNEEKVEIKSRIDVFTDTVLLLMMMLKMNLKN